MFGSSRGCGKSAGISSPSPLAFAFITAFASFRFISNMSPCARGDEPLIHRDLKPLNLLLLLGYKLDRKRAEFELSDWRPLGLSMRFCT